MEQPSARKFEQEQPLNERALLDVAEVVAAFEAQNLESEDFEELNYLIGRVEDPDKEQLGLLDAIVRANRQDSLGDYPITPEDRQLLEVLLARIRAGYREAWLAHAEQARDAIVKHPGLYVVQTGDEHRVLSDIMTRPAFETNLKDPLLWVSDGESHERSTRDHLFINIDKFVGEERAAVEQYAREQGRRLA